MLMITQHSGDDNLDSPLPVEEVPAPIVPSHLPSPWILGGVDAASGAPYYVNTETGESTWVRPGMAASSVAPSLSVAASHDIPDRDSQPSQLDRVARSWADSDSDDYPQPLGARLRAPRAGLGDFGPAAHSQQPSNADSQSGIPATSAVASSVLSSEHEARARVSSSDASRVAVQAFHVPPRFSGNPNPLSAGGSSIASNRTEFVVAFGSSLPGKSDSGASVSKLRWSVELVRTFMDSPSLSRASVVSEILSVKIEDVRSCMPVELVGIMSHYGDGVSPFVIAHSLKRHQILSWYSSVAAVVGTRSIMPKLFCPAHRMCQITPCSSAKLVCSVCARMIYLGSSVAQSSANDFSVCEACCRNPTIQEQLASNAPRSLNSSSTGVPVSSNAACDLLELLLKPRSFLPAADNFSPDSWHLAMDIWMRLLRDVVPSSPSSSAVRPRHIITLQGRVSTFKRRVSEPQFHFRVSDLDQANVCEAMKQIFDSRTKINLKLADARQGSVDDSKLTVLFRHSAKAGQAAGMPASIHSDGITPVMYSILALEFSNPKKFAAEMWLPCCCVDDNVASCGLFPRPFIPDASPSERKLQEETLERFLLLGRCIGIALRDRRVFMLPLSLAFADALCGKKLSLWDACLGEIDLQEDDGFSANRSVLHAIEHCLEFATSFSMVYRGRDLSNQRCDVPISENSFFSAGLCSICDVPVNFTCDAVGGIYVNVTAEAVQHVADKCRDGDHAYVVFAGQLPLGLSRSRAYRVVPVAGCASPRLTLCDVAAAAEQASEPHTFPVSMHVLRVYSNDQAAGDAYLRAVEVLCVDIFLFSLSFYCVSQAYCLRSGIQLQIDATRRGIDEFVPFHRLEVRTTPAVHAILLHDRMFQELCGDGLLEALGVTTNGEWGVSDDAWEDFVNNVRYPHAQ